MDVSYTRAASAAIVWIVSYGKEADAFFEVASFDDFIVEVMNDGDVKSNGA